MGKGRTAEALGSVTGSLPKLEREVEALKQSRKDLGRFLDIDREKAELEALAHKKAARQKEIDGLEIAYQARVAEILANATAAGNKIIEKAMVEASLILSQAQEARKKVAEERLALDQERKNVDAVKAKLANDLAAFAIDRKAFELLRSDVRSAAIATSLAIKPLL